MDLRDLITLAGIVSPELLNRIQPSAPAADCGCGVEEEAPAAGFDRATTEPSEETFDDPMTSAGSTVDLSLRRYLKAKGDHVTVDENVYPDYTVEDVSEAYAAFKEGKYKSDAQRKAVHAAKAEESIDEVEVDEAEIELAPGYTIKTDKPGIFKGTKTTSGFVGGKSGEAMYVANRVLDAIEEQDPNSSEEVFALARKFCKEMGCTDDAKKRVYKQLAKIGWAESLDEADIDENAFNQAAAAAARANKDSFEFNGKTYKTKMDKSTAHKLDDDVDMLRKLAGLA